MEVDKDARVLDLENSTIWLSREGIMYSKPRPNAPTDSTREQILSEMDRLREFLGNKKVCMVLEANPQSRPPTKELRDLIAEALSSITKAMAIVTTSPLSRMIANLFFSFKPPEYPVKMFATEEEATKWVKQYL
jgi:hypothetical protein